MSALERQIAVRIANRQRAARGLPPLKWVELSPTGKRHFRTRAQRIIDREFKRIEARRRRNAIARTYPRAAAWLAHSTKRTPA